METYLIIFGISLLLIIISNLWLVIVGFKRSIVWGVIIFLFSPLAAIVFAFTNWFDAKKAFLLYIISFVGLATSIFLMANEGVQERLIKISTAVEAGQIRQNEMVLYLADPNKLLPDEMPAEDEDLDGDENIDSPEVVATGPDSGSPDKRADEVIASKDEVIAAKANESKSTTDTEDKKKADDELVVILEEKESVVQEYPTKGQVTADPLIGPKKKTESESVRVSLKKVKNYLGRYFIVKTRKGTEHRGILVKITKSRLILKRKIYGGTFTYKISKKRIKRLDMLKKEYVDDLSS